MHHLASRTFLAAIALLAIILGACSPASATPSSLPPTSAPPATSPPTDTPAPTLALQPTSTPDPLPALSLNPGDMYFTLNGKPGLIFSRNLAGMTPGGFEVLAEMAHQAGNVLVRVSTDSPAMGGHVGYGYSSTGELDQRWSGRWEHFFTVAEANGIYVVPIFTGWINWNTTGYNTWAQNPLNATNGGPASDPRQIYKRDSPTQQLYIQWFKSVVARWQVHRNIAAWEPITEVNLINGIGQADAEYLAEQLAAAARAADPLHRPVSSSLANTGTWPDFYRHTSNDFISVHPYPPSGRLDRDILSTVRSALAAYGKPVLIGESGLSAATPDSAAGKLVVAANAHVGIQHAIWAGVVSGAMNARALWWEDGYGIYFPQLGMPWILQYASSEVAAIRFVSDLDMRSFRPVPSKTSAGIFGAALGDPHVIIGWYRDSSSEPPDWPLKSVGSGQTVTLTVPGTASSWKVDFYDAGNGTRLIRSATVPQKSGTVVLTLPDFTDDIALKMVRQP